MNCLTKLFQQKRRRIGYILAFSGPMISKRDSSDNSIYNYCPRYYNTYIHRLHIHIPKSEENYYCFPCYFLFSHTFILRFLDFVVPILFLMSFRHSNQYRLSILHEQPIRFQEEYFVLFSSNTHSNLPFLQLKWSLIEITPTPVLSLSSFLIIPVTFITAKSFLRS